MKKIELSYPMVILFAFLVKTMIISATFPDALIIFGLIAYQFLSQEQFISKKVKDFNKAIVEFKETQDRQTKKIEQLEGNLSSVKLAAGVRSNTIKLGQNNNA